MTEFKKVYDLFLDDYEQLLNFQNFLSPTDRTRAPKISVPVFDFLNIFCKHFQKHLNLTDTIVFFNNPISINAQSSKNRTGYGNNYFYNTLIYEGTKYGETSQFPIVGYKISKIWNIQGNSMYCKTPDGTIYGRSLPG